LSILDERDRRVSVRRDGVQDQVRTLSLFAPTASYGAERPFLGPSVRSRIQRTTLCNLHLNRNISQAQERQSVVVDRYRVEATSKRPTKRHHAAGQKGSPVAQTPYPHVHNQWDGLDGSCSMPCVQ
jgi:hypothetical protein